MLQEPLDSGTAERLVAAVAEAMDVESYRQPVPKKAKRAAGWPGDVALEIRGRLRLPSERAYDLVAERFRGLGFVAFFRRAGNGEVLVLAVPGELPSEGGGVRLPAILFLATMASVIFVGALNSAEPDGRLDVASGLVYAGSLLAILVAHEMGHYLTARRMGMPASLPYFIPMPLPPLGTFGAAMVMKAPPRNRRGLLALGAAGPVAGLVVAVPVLMLGLLQSQVSRIPIDQPTIQEGNSLLYLGVKYLLFGRILPSGGIDVFLGPMAWAGWVGLLVTGLNLVPAGQLDGGHVLYAFLGARARTVVWFIVAVLVLLATRWEGWLLWVGVILVFGRVHAVPLDDVTPLSGRERLFALFMLVVALLVFIPVPMLVQGPLG